MTEILVRTDAFEGPLDLLCHLIDKNEVSIYDIPIALITDQYLKWMETHLRGEIAMDNLSEFVVLAATLLEIKSAMLLPGKKSETDEEEIDPRLALVQQLEEYRRVKEIAEELKIFEAEAERSVYGRPDPSLPQTIMERAAPDIGNLLDGVTLAALYKAFQETLARREAKTDKIRGGFDSVRRDVFTIAEKQEHILELLKVRKAVKFNDVFDNDTSRVEIIVTFLALLELLRAGRAAAFQEGMFGEIYIKSTGTELSQ